MEAIKSPFLMSNVDDSEEPTLQGKYQKSIIIDRYARKIGIIGVVLSTYDVCNRIQARIICCQLNQDRRNFIFLSFVNRSESRIRTS